MLSRSTSPSRSRHTTDHPIGLQLSTQQATLDGTVAVVEEVLKTDGAALAETRHAFSAAAAA
jgi:hypothetical protein